MKNLVLNKREKNISCRKERKNGFVPGIMYGKNMQNFLFEVGDIEVNREIDKIGEHGIVNVLINGQNKEALLKEVQRDPVNRKIIHLDLQEISQMDKIKTNIPITFVNEGMVSKNGGIVQKEKNSIKVECSANNLPKSINVDLNDLNFKNVLRISDVEFSEDLIVIDDLNSVIASVDYEPNQAIDEEISDIQNEDNE